MAKNGKKRGPVLEEDAEPCYSLTVCFEDEGSLNKFIGSKEGTSREEEIEDAGNRGDS